MMNHNTSWKWMGGVSAALLGVALAGCGGKTDAVDTTVATTSNTAVATTSTATAPAGDRIVSAGGFENAATTWGQIEMARTDLDQVVSDKKLKEVHEAAFKVRDLVTTLPAQSASLPDDKRKILDTHVTEVAQLAGMMDEAGDAGNLKSTHEHHMAMNDALDMMEGLYPRDVMDKAMAHMGGRNHSGGMSRNGMRGGGMDGSGMRGGGMRGGGMRGGGMRGGGMGGPGMQGGGMGGSNPSGSTMPGRGSGGAMSDDNMGGGFGGTMPGNNAGSSQPTVAPTDSSGGS